MGNTRFQRLTAITAIQPLALAVSALALTAPASAQVALEEVLVTAERRTESVQEMPIAITAFTEDQIADLGIIDLGDLTPQLSRHRRGATAVSLSGRLSLPLTSSMSLRLLPGSCLVLRS